MFTPYLVISEAQVNALQDVMDVLEDDAEDRVKDVTRMVEAIEKVINDSETDLNESAPAVSLLCAVLVSLLVSPDNIASHTHLVLLCCIRSQADIIANAFGSYLADEYLQHDQMCMCCIQVHNVFKHHTF